MEVGEVAGKHDRAVVGRDFVGGLDIRACSLDWLALRRGLITGNRRPRFFAGSPLSRPSRWPGVDERCSKTFDVELVFWSTRPARYPHRHHLFDLDLTLGANDSTPHAADRSDRSLQHTVRPLFRPHEALRRRGHDRLPPGAQRVDGNERSWPRFAKSRCCAGGGPDSSEKPLDLSLARSAPAGSSFDHAKKSRCRRSGDSSEIEVHRPSASQPDLHTELIGESDDLVDEAKLLGRWVRRHGPRMPIRPSATRRWVACRRCPRMFGARFGSCAAVAFLPMCLSRHVRAARSRCFRDCGDRFGWCERGGIDP